MRTFHVVTQRRWMVDELAAGLGPAGWHVVGHHGLSALPPEVGHTPGHVLWAPGAFAAREIVGGNNLRLSAPGAAWLPTATDTRKVDCLDDGRRTVTLTTAVAAVASPADGFWKLAESKLDLFPARWRTSGELVEDIRAARLPELAALHYTPTRLSFLGEWRALVTNNRVTGVSCYIDSRGRDLSDPLFTEPATVVTATAARIAKVFAEIIGNQVPAGPAYTLDVGRTSTGRWAIIEANPVWSSAWYGLGLPEFADAVAAAQGDDVPPDHVWRPDPVLLEAARRVGPLPVDLR